MKKGKRKKNYKLAGGEIRGSLYTYTPDTTVCIKKYFFVLIIINLHILWEKLNYFTMDISWFFF